MENSWDVMSGIYAVKDLLGVNQVIIAIENNKPDAIAHLARPGPPDTGALRYVPLQVKVSAGR